MSDILLFQIPVYRVSPEQDAQEVREWVAGALRGVERAAGDRTFDRRHHAGYAEQLFTRGLPWSYNQVVGWIEIEWNGPGPAIKAQGFKVDVKQVRRNFTRDYRWIQGNLFECWIHDESSAEIGRLIRAKVVGLTKAGRPFARRYVDLRAFDSVVPRFEWRALLGLDP